jgi:hypothetical protein
MAICVPFHQALSNTVWALAKLQELPSDAWMHHCLQVGFFCGSFSLESAGLCAIRLQDRRDVHLCTLHPVFTVTIIKPGPKSPSACQM